jgi:hypothetical protein
MWRTYISFTWHTTIPSSEYQKQPAGAPNETPVWGYKWECHWNRRRQICP